MITCVLYRCIDITTALYNERPTRQGITQHSLPTTFLHYEPQAVQMFTTLKGNWPTLKNLQAISILTSTALWLWRAKLGMA